MNKLWDTHHTLLKHHEILYERECYKTLSISPRMTGIVGPRGIGKTTFLLYLIKNNLVPANKSLYFSTDNIYFSTHTLVDTVETFIKEYDGECVCIDEIHRYPRWTQELKNIYDSFPHIKIIFTGSSSIDILHETYDLSRRVVMQNMVGFSFREFLEWKYNEAYPILHLDDIIHRRKENILQRSQKGLWKAFKEYLAWGYYPSAHEFDMQEHFFGSLMNTTDKVIYQDIAVYNTLKTPTLNIFKKILAFITTSSPGEISINKLARTLKKDHTDTAKYFDILMNSGLIRYLLINKTGHKLIRNAKKVYIDNTNLLHALSYFLGKECSKGTIRELYTIQHLQNSGHNVFFSKQGDIQVGEYILEIGGKSKSIQQIQNLDNAYLIKDDIFIGDNTSIPLYLFGFLY